MKFRMRSEYEARGMKVEKFIFIARLQISMTLSPALLTYFNIWVGLASLNMKLCAECEGEVQI